MIKLKTPNELRTERLLEEHRKLEYWWERLVKYIHKSYRGEPLYIGSHAADEDFTPAIRERLAKSGWEVIGSRITLSIREKK